MIAAASTANSISAPVFNCCSRVIAARSSASLVGGEVHHLAAGHARRPRRASQFEHQVGADERVLMGLRIGQNFERHRMKAVAGEHRDRFAESLVNGRLAAAKVVIVHARQIVVDQRIDVDRLDRGAGPDGAVLGDPEQARCGDGQQAAGAACRRRSRHGAIAA